MDGGGHMWNIVRMPDGKTCIADVTACDSIPADASEKFLQGYQYGSVQDGYVINLAGAVSLIYVRRQYPVDLHRGDADAGGQGLFAVGEQRGGLRRLRHERELVAG